MNSWLKSQVLAAQTRINPESDIGYFKEFLKEHGINADRLVFKWNFNGPVEKR